ncbi:hypothetical protein OY671_013032, partial [Metschnikowia pulcherrima]
PGNGARPAALLPRGAGAAGRRRARPDAGRVPGTAPLRPGVPGRPPDPDGVGAVVLARRAHPGIPGSLPGAVHGQPPDAAGRPAAPMARGAGRVQPLHPRPARASERAGAPESPGVPGHAPGRRRHPGLVRGPAALRPGGVRSPQ